MFERTHQLGRGMAGVRRRSPVSGEIDRASPFEDFDGLPNRAFERRFARGKSRLHVNNGRPE